MPSVERLPPKHTQVLIMGAGPAGSYAASALAREGLDVTVFEADKFPRYHVGESLIPSIRPYFRFIGAESILENYGFIRKPGSAIKFNQFKREGYTDFTAIGPNNNAWNVIRSEFDQLVMNHARTSGASIYELTKVTGISFSSTDPSQPSSVTWSHKTPQPISFDGKLVSSSSTSVGTTTFTYLIDATGRAGILSTKYLKNRYFNASLKNLAVWGYWKNVGVYGVGTPRQGAPWFEALTDQSGWVWFIPLHDGTASVGVVMDQKWYNDLKDSPYNPPIRNFDPPLSTMGARYLSNISLAPGVVELITPNGQMIEGSVKSASDYSYSAPSYAGNRYRIIGDAGAFIDPFFSSGIHLALTSALSAAATICASIRGDCSEVDAANWHTRRVSASYTRFQLVVLSAYKQIRAQDLNVLSDINEDNFDRAFALLRPVIQGASDMGTQLFETELQKSIDFCVDIFNPTTTEQHERLSRSPGIESELLDVNSPIVDPKFLDIALHVARRNANLKTSPNGDSDEGKSPSDAERAMEDKRFLNKVNARKVVHAEYAGNSNMESEPLEGFVMRLERGQLGLSIFKPDS